MNVASRMKSLKLEIIHAMRTANVRFVENEFDLCIAATLSYFTFQCEIVRMKKNVSIWICSEDFRSMLCTSMHDIHSNSCFEIISNVIIFNMTALNQHIHTYKDIWLILSYANIRRSKIQSDSSVIYERISCYLRVRIFWCERAYNGNGNVNIYQCYVLLTNAPYL